MRCECREPVEVSLEGQLRGGVLHPCHHGALASERGHEAPASFRVWELLPLAGTHLPQRPPSTGRARLMISESYEVRYWYLLDQSSPW